MKNFTNNFKQFTSRLSARWLIMALMLLLGTSSAWATVYLKGSWNWNEGIAIGDNGGSCSVTLNGNNTYWFYINNYYSGQDHNHKANGTMKSNDCTDWWFNGSNDCAIETTITGEYIFSYYWKDGVPVVSVTYPVEPCTNEYYLKHDFGGDEGDWEWKELTDCENNIYTLTAIYGGGGCNYSQPNSTNEGGYIASPTLEGNPVIGDECIFTFDANNKTIKITKVNKCTPTTYSISFADNATSINKGATVQASVSPNSGIGTIIWESSAPSIATISSTGEITGNKGGEATITATIADGDTYCSGTETKDITVKETPTITISGDTYGCNENKTLTANVGNDVTASYTVKWYKGDINTTAIGTGSTYTATGSGTYYAQVTGTYINPVTSNGFVFNKYDATPVPQITLASNSICAGSTTTLTINEYNANSYSYKLYNGNNVVGSPVFNNGVYTLSSAGNYYVTATPISGVCQVESAKQQTAATLTVTSVTLELNPTSAPVCSGATIANINKYVTATATVTPSVTASVNWYASENEPTALPVDTRLSAKTYYAEAVTTSGCKSGRKPFTITSLMTAPTVPVITPSDAAICSGNAVTLTLETKVAGETYTIGNTEVFTKSNTWSTPPLSSKTDYVVTAYNSCGSTPSDPITINVTTTPTITGPSATQPNKEITLSSAAGASTNWKTTGGTLTPETGTETVFTTTSNGNYTITAKNTDNNITCSATHEIVVNDKFYIYIRRPKSGDAIYSDWYGKTNEADKGGAAWFKKGVPDDNNLSDTNYGGDGPLTYFEDCNGYIWDGYQGVTGNFYIHAPNTGGQDGWATFTKAVNVTSLTTDKYYIISSWISETKGANLAERTGNNIPTRIPEVAVPVLSIDPVSGIICQNAEATITVTNPEDGVTYTLNYEGKDQENPISYTTGTEEVKYTVSEAGTYLVKAETTSGACKGNSSSSPKEVKVITTAVSFSQSDYYTTPWIPVTVQINVPKGYEYTYSDAALTSITPETDAPIKKANDTAYTYTFPRPTSWGIGNSANGDGFGEKTYTVNASIKNAEECGSASATVHLQDEGNDNCTTTNH